MRIVGPEFALLIEFRTVPAAVVAESLGLEELLPVLDDMGMGWIELCSKVRRSAPHMSAIANTVDSQRVHSAATSLTLLARTTRPAWSLRTVWRR